MRLVPHVPLLWLGLLLIVPGMTLAVYDTGALRLLGVLMLLVWLAVALIDGLRSRRLLDNVRVEFPELVRSTKGREATLPISFSNEGDEIQRMRFGVATSPWFHFDGEITRWIERLPSGKKLSIDYPLTPLKRGQYFLDSIHLERRSPLGFWLVRQRHDLTTEFRVYPDLSTERKRLSSLFLMRGNEGSHMVRQVGKGRDFEQLRDYQPGDDYVDIDWKATARRQMPVTRTYQVERTQEVYVIVDHSRLSGREICIPLDEASREDWEYMTQSAGGDQVVTTQLEKFLHCSLILASVAERQGDLFGFVSFADKVDRLIRGRNGKDHYNLVRDALYTLEPKTVSPDFEQLMISLRQRLTRRALLVMLVDLSDPLTAEQFYDALPLINKQHLVLVNMVRPEHAFPLFSVRNAPDSVDEVYQNLAGHLQWQELRDTGNRLRHLGVELGIPEHEELCTETVTQYLNVKKRQLI
ncbi:MAG: DUF58 domain-containing protein [Verrucomicrobiota bacterium]